MPRRIDRIDLKINIYKIMVVNSCVCEEELKLIFKLFLHSFLFSKMLISKEELAIPQNIVISKVYRVRYIK